MSKVAYRDPICDRTLLTMSLNSSSETVGVPKSPG